MKINLKSLFGIKPRSADTLGVDEKNNEYDKHVDFYYTNLVNSIILYSLTSKELKKLSGPAFNPMTELETEIEYAFTPVCFETIFRKGLIDKSIREELLQFKKSTDNIPTEIWNWECIDTNEVWITTRLKANALLDKLGVKSRTYNESYTTVYDNEGRTIKKGENCP